MNTDSPLFDRIRVKPDQDRRLRAELPACEWPDAALRLPIARLKAVCASANIGGSASITSANTITPTISLPA